MRYFLFLSTLLLTKQQAVVNTLQTSYQQNYAIGYSNSSCVRISMFRFQSAASGQASTLTLNFVPDPLPNMGNLSISLYSGTATTNTIGLPLNVQFNTNTNQGTYSLTNSNWTFVRGSTYFLTFDTQSRLRMSYYSSSAGTTYSLTLQTAPLCNSTQWTTLMNSASILPILINISSTTLINSVTSYTSTNTATNSPTNAPTSTPTNSRTTNTELVGLNPSSTPLYSSTSITTSTLEPTLSNTYSIYVLASPSHSASVSTFAQSQTVSASLYPSSNTITSNAAASTAYSPTVIAGYSLGVIGLVLSITCILYSISKKREPQLFSSVVISNPGLNLQPTQVFSNPVTTQPVNTKPANHWYRVVEGSDTYYYNHELKKSEWLLPEGGIVIGDGLPRV